MPPTIILFSPGSGVKAPLLEYLVVFFFYRFTSHGVFNSPIVRIARHVLFPKVSVDAATELGRRTNTHKSKSTPELLHAVALVQT